MIEEVLVENLNSVTFRITSDIGLDQYLRDIEIQDAKEIDEYLEVASTNVLSEPNALVDRVFNYPPNTDYKSRFSDGNFCVYYSALELETAIAEKSFHLASILKDEYPDICYFRVLNCDFNGSVKNLIPLKTDVQCLTTLDKSGYDDCIEIAKEAISNGLDALITPSARQENGRCLPVFKRAPLSNAEFGEIITFSFDQESTKVVHALIG